MLQSSSVDLGCFVAFWGIKLSVLTTDQNCNLRSLFFQETLTPPGHLVSPLVCRGPWMSTVVLYCWFQVTCISSLVFNILFNVLWTLFDVIFFKILYKALSTKGSPTMLIYSVRIIIYGPYHEGFFLIQSDFEIVHSSRSFFFELILMNF